MKTIHDKRVEAAGKVLDKASVLAFGFVTRPEANELARAALEAADAVEAEGQIAEVIATVIETHKDTIGTHWPECWKYHAGCLAVLLRDLGGAK